MYFILQTSFCHKVYVERCLVAGVVSPGLPPTRPPTPSFSSVWKLFYSGLTGTRLEAGMEWLSEMRRLPARQSVCLQAACARRLLAAALFVSGRPPILRLLLARCIASFFCGFLMLCKADLIQLKTLDNIFWIVNLKKMNVLACVSQLAEAAIYIQ